MSPAIKLLFSRHGGLAALVTLIVLMMVVKLELVLVLVLRRLSLGSEAILSGGRDTKVYRGKKRPGPLIVLQDS